MSEHAESSATKVAREKLSQAAALDDSRLPEKISLYEGGLALYPTDPELVTKLTLELAQAFFIGKAYRLAKHRLREVLSASTTHPAEALRLKTELDNISMAKSPSYPEEFVRIGEPEFRKITYSVEKMWKLDAPTENLPITELENHLAMRYWATPGNHHDLAPLDVIAHPDKYNHEYSRIAAADLSHPLDVCEWRGNLMMLDGLHRLAKAKMLGNETVDVRKVPFESLLSISTVFED